MNRPDKSLVRFAIFLRGLVVGRAPSTRIVELPEGIWRQAQDLLRRSRRAESRHWHLAAESLRRDLRYLLGSFGSYLRELEHSLFCPESTTYSATANDLLRDLEHLKEEFDSFTIDGERRFVSVVTEPVTLENRYFGTFEIRLDLHGPLQGARYRVHALDPQPSASRSDVVHPHVCDGVLCEGDGHAVIRSALAQGRLFDFFEIVRRLLTTYNPASPFVELTFWDGEDCSDCGETTRPENRYECQRCESLTCIDCASTCSGCDSSFCADCIGSCQACHQAYCGECLRACSVCNREICTSCLDIEERCPHCHED